MLARNCKPGAVRVNPTQNTMIPQPMPHQLDATDGHGAGIRVRFFWQRDRYVHVVEAIGADVAPLLASADSDANAQWPDDPPLQQLSVEPVGVDRAVLGVGQAGGSHWSISVEARPGDRPALRFDIACRCTDPPPQRLGSRYRDAANHARRPSPEGGIQWTVADGVARLHVDQAIGPARLTPESDQRMLRVVAGDDDAAAGAAAAGSRTVRWGFVIALAR